MGELLALENKITGSLTDGVLQLFLLQCVKCFTKMATLLKHKSFFRVKIIQGLDTLCSLMIYLIYLTQSVMETVVRSLHLRNGRQPLKAYVEYNCLGLNLIANPS